MSARAGGGRSDAAQMSGSRRPLHIAPYFRLHSFQSLQCHTAGTVEPERWQARTHAHCSCLCFLLIGMRERLDGGTEECASHVHTRMYIGMTSSQRPREAGMPPVPPPPPLAIRTRPLNRSDVFAELFAHFFTFPSFY